MAAPLSVSTAGMQWQWSTPLPEPRPEVQAPDPPRLAPMKHAESARLRRAAFHATRVYPGPVGEVLSRELLMWEEFGYRFGGTDLVMRLVADIEKRHAAQSVRRPEPE